MKKFYSFLSTIIFVILVTALTNCTKESDTSQTTIQNVLGYAQKGPFINGSSVTAYDLKSDLSPTGKSFNMQITDNKGSFQLNNVSLSSNYVSLRADGFYFNEVLGQQSVAQITLYTLSDISGKSDININILTHLEKPRVEYLMKNGKSFADSKIQAQKEILAIFNIEKSNIKTSENLNISETGDDNGILLAISSILQSYRSESEMSELLSNISKDIQEDGILNSDTLGSALINQAVALDTVAIKSNLSKRYSDIGATVSIPDFGKYISNFITKTKYVITKPLITYPETGLNGDNILSLTKINFDLGVRRDTTFSLAAQLAKGASVKIKITSVSSDTSMTSKAYWYYAAGSNVNWTISEFDRIAFIQTFTATESGKSCDLKMKFNSGTFLVEYYEMSSTTATRKKTITVN